MDTQHFKSLQVKKTKIQGEIIDLRKTLKELDKQLGERERAFDQVQRELDAVLKNNPVISEHAMLRYVERFLGVNLKEIEKDILSEETLKIINKISSGKIPYKKDHVLIVKNKTIVTITDRA
jgi:uncharacterized protein YydD (DUF2326 family)